MKPTTIAADVAKSVVEIAVSEKPGRFIERQRFSRTQFARFLGRREPATLRPALADTLAEIRELESRLRATERQLEALAQQTPLVERLRTIPGVGLVSATALVAFVGDAQRFPTGRHFASYLGLTPRESSSGLRRRLGAISKRGDSYLRMLLIHGARSLLCHAQRAWSPSPLQAWALRLQQLRGHNKAAVALANKLARIVWAVWKKGHDFTQPLSLEPMSTEG